MASLNYIIPLSINISRTSLLRLEDVVPLSVVEKTVFQKLIRKIVPGLQLKGRTFFTNLLELRYSSGKTSLTKALESASDVATTADCWTSRRISYLGETVHWFDENLNRQNECPAIRRIIGSHTHDVLARAMESIHVQYQIVDKISVTTTDSGSNFLKAFKEFGNSNIKQKRDQADPVLLNSIDAEDIVIA